MDVRVFPVIGVPESTVMVTVPAGIVVPVSEATVIVKVSLAFNAGAVFDAETAVVVPISAGPVLAGQAFARLARSTVPSPET